VNECELPGGALARRVSGAGGASNPPPQPVCVGGVSGAPMTDKPKTGENGRGSKKNRPWMDPAHKAFMRRVHPEEEEESVCSRILRGKPTRLRVIAGRPALWGWNLGLEGDPRPSRTAPHRNSTLIHAPGPFKVKRRVHRAISGRWMS
jgi:hypothetical protein